ncbi:MAG: peptide ABC transporter substrate-binding protein [Cereibacter sphaeroides]|uniref:Peptide ABC transporter substrate-binding protein n=1 Tax=Cereibacter sphaeroides TaxID=1063 RepID=A0A2W5S0X6_CERSP|nr:MAG: peptide ABC transporter substrate-binding protein [Cereibacter sphaeroides]
MITRRGTLVLLAAAALPRSARAVAVAEIPFFQAKVDAGELPPMALRLPNPPRTIPMAAMGRAQGQHGGSVRMLIGGQRDIRLVPIYSYSRLVGYDENLVLQPDILESVTVEEDRIYTLRLRRNHRWSDGSPFTTEDFRYVWDDVINNKELYRGGVPTDLKVKGEVCTFEVIDPLTVRFSWSNPMPDFLPQLAAPSPLLLALPSTYLKQFHARYQDEAKLAEFIKANRVDDWVSLHQKMSRQTRPENPDLPTLEAWRPRTAPPAEQFVFERNPYFHRVDEAGSQLPYFDRFVLSVASSEIISAKTATGETDLQSNGISFTDYTLLKHSEQMYQQNVALWRRTLGSSVALLPNMNCKDPVWRKLFQDVRVRRAMSMAIDRAEINKVIFYGLGRESADTVLPESPLFKPEYATAWAQHDPELANALLDEAGLSRRDYAGRRLLPDGRLAGIVVESSGESTLETDVLELITDHFRAIGLPLFSRASQRAMFRSRARAGEVLLSVWQGIDNAVPTANMTPSQLAPTTDDQLQWPMWGLYYMSAETQGKPPELPEAQRLVELLQRWRETTSTEQRTAIWTEMLQIRADQVFSIGTVNGVFQPVVHARRMRNVPKEALFGYEPTSYYGAYMPDTFFYEGGA